MPTVVFWGTSEFSVITFDVLLSLGVRPLFLVTTPDKPQGRHLKLTPSPAKQWAEKNNITVLQPDKLKTPPFADILASHAPKQGYDVFIVSSYGKIIPPNILNLPKRGVLNIHPSLLPKYRGPSPVQSAILADDANTGVTIMCMDEEMDHGPIVAQKKIPVHPWPQSTRALKKLLGTEGATMLSSLLPAWIKGTIQPTAQNHSEATYTKKFEKADGEITMEDTPYQRYLKFQAFYDSIGIYYFDTVQGKRVRIKITDATYESDTFVIKKVIPEGKKEMSYDTYMRTI